MTNPKPMFLINYNQTQILKYNSFLQKPMSSDNNVTLSSGKSFNSFFLLFCTAKTWQKFNMNPKRLKPVWHCLIMLERKNCRRHNNRNLFTWCNCFKNPTHCNFSFTKTNIATNQPIHRLFTFHISFYIIYSFHLIRSFRVFKSFFHLNLPSRIRQELNTVLHFTFCVQSQQIISNLFDLFFNTSFSVFPIFSAHSGKFWFDRTWSTITDKQIYLFSRNM